MKIIVCGIVRLAAMRILRGGEALVACAIAVLSLSAAEVGANAESKQTRAFRMGFTAFPFAFTQEAVEQTRAFVRTNGDLIAHHIEGVPWAEALANKPYPSELMQQRMEKRLMRPPGAKVYLAISPGRGELKLAEKGTTPLPAGLKGKSYDDALVKQAYLNYCRASIDFFKPDYLAIGIEVNEIYSAGKEKWRAYAELHRYVYRELKKEHPNLPIFASYTLHNLIKEKGAMLKACRELMDCNDFVAISFYPFLTSENPEAAFQWLQENFDSFGKPYAMAETNDTAERTELPKSKVVLNGNPQKQAAYVRTLLELAERRKFPFVVLFIHQDYDQLWERIKGSTPEFFMAWRDCGLLDEAGKERPAFRVWRDYFERPLKEN